MLTKEENEKLDAAFPGLRFEVPPVSTANWDYNAWHRWLLSHAWKKEGNYFVHYQTGERTLWHPLTVQIGETVYKAHKKLTAHVKRR